VRNKFAIAWHGFALGMVLPNLAAAGVTPLPRAQVERAVIASVPAWQGHDATVLKYLDLTQPFATASSWSLVVLQDPHPQEDVMSDEQNPIAVCFADGRAPHCVTFQQCGVTPSGEPDGYMAWFAKSCEPVRIFSLVDLQVVHAGARNTRPLLLLKTADMGGLNGSRNIRTILYRYDRSANRFRAVFTHDSAGSNNNQAARFMETGPLRGDVIVDFPTQHAPYAYWIEVFAPGKSGQYVRALRYRGHTGYGDGNRLSVADSEMPEILERMGLWKQGDPLPIPTDRFDCMRPYLSHEEEWCD
jgi:hypothetical protein